MSKHRNRIIITSVLILVISSMLAGCGGGGMLGAALRITGATALLPDEWRSTDNMIKILADITGSGIKSVVAYIKRLGDDDPAPVILTETAPGTFEGEFLADGNDNPAQSAEYTITVQASDTAGNQATSETLSVEVPSAESETDPAP